MDDEACVADTDAVDDDEKSRREGRHPIRGLAPPPQPPQTQTEVTFTLTKVMSTLRYPVNRRKVIWE